jgi:hypothetical protein
MAVQSLLLLVQISLLLLVTHDRAKDIQSKRDTHQRYLDCTRAVTYHFVPFSNFVFLEPIARCWL